MEILIPFQLKRVVACCQRSRRFLAGHSTKGNGPFLRKGFSPLAQHHCSATVMLILKKRASHDVIKIHMMIRSSKTIALYLVHVIGIYAEASIV